MLFSFLFAANLREPLGPFLAANWNQFPDEYAVMLGFGIVFVAATIAFTLVIQGFYHHQPLFAKYTFVDEVLGGILGVIQGAVPDRLHHRHPRLVLPDPRRSRRRRRELPFLRGFFDFYDTTRRRPSSSDRS